jgi:O-antigen biosynthesis protein
LKDREITAVMPVDSFHPEYLEAALESVLHQTSGAWRLLIVTESGRELQLKDHLADYLLDRRVDLIVNQGRKLAGALNTGMRAARTEFVAILLGDDMWAPKAVEVLGNQIGLHPEVDFLHSSRRIVGERGEPLSSVHLSRTDVRLEHFGSPSPVKHLLCWRRSKALLFGGMDERLNSVGPDDFDFPWSMAEHGAVFRAIPDCLYIYRDHRSAARLTTHLPLSVHVREIRRIMRKHGADSAKVERAVRNARDGHLRQCLYRSRLDRWLREALGMAPATTWRETYR